MQASILRKCYLPTQVLFNPLPLHGLFLHPHHTHVHAFLSAQSLASQPHCHSAKSSCVYTLYGIAPQIPTQHLSHLSIYAKNILTLIHKLVDYLSINQSPINISIYPSKHPFIFKFISIHSYIHLYIWPYTVLPLIKKKMDPHACSPICPFKCLTTHP